VLDLEPRVHLEEVEVALGVHEELDGARVDVAGGARQPARRLAHARAQRRVQRAATGTPRSASGDAAGSKHSRSPRWMTLSCVSASTWNLDVPRLGDRALEIDRGVAEGGAGLGARARSASPGRLATHQPHALAPPPITALSITG